MNRFLLLLALCAPSAFAEESLRREQVRVHLHDYHRGERLSGFVPFVGSGAGWVNIRFGALEVIAGLYFALSSYGKERALDEALTANPAEFARSERERVGRILNRFQPILLAVEGAISAGGGVLAGVGALQRNELMLGLGLGFAVQGRLTT